MLKNLTVIFLLLFCANISSQNRGNIWYLGDLSLDFNSQPVNIITTTNSRNIQSMIGDVSGNVIASYDGTNLYNKDDEIVFENDRFDIAQSSVIVKKPGCNDTYYLFETKTIKKPSQGALRPEHLISRLFYSSFNIADNGQVDLLEKDILYSQDLVYTGLTSYSNFDHSKTWIIGSSGSEILSILINEQAPQEAVRSNASGPKVQEHFDNGWFALNTSYQIKVSTDGKYLALFVKENNNVINFELVKDDGFIELFDFNSDEGTAEKREKIEKGNTDGLIFWPRTGEFDGSNFYGVITSKEVGFGFPNKQAVYYYDLNAADIKDSEVKIFEELLTNVKGIQKTPNGKVYMGAFSVTGTNDILAEIDGLTINTIMSTDVFHQTSFPTFPQSYFESRLFAKNLCFGEEVMFTSNLIEETISFQWNFGDGSVSNDEEPNYTYGSSGEYLVNLEVEDINGTTISYDLMINIIDDLTSDTLPQIVYKCSNVEEVELDAGTFETYLWSTGETTQKILVSNPGQYTVEVGNRDCCTGILTTTLIENEAPEIFELNYDELNNTITVDASGNGFLTYFLDDLPGQSDVTFGQLSLGNHTVRVVDSNGCSAEKSIEITVKVPSHFSPNNDGINDVFRIPQLETGDLQFEFTIYDRHRRIIQRFKDEQILWNGTFNGQVLPTDDYWYVLNVEGQIFKGHFSLLK